MRLRSSARAVGACIALLAMTATADAASETLQYRVHHATYGDIGGYTNLIDRSGEMTTVHSELHLTVKLLGIVVWRQEAFRTEEWRQKRLVAFDGITVTNGKRLEVHGEARGDHFVISAPRGTIEAPATVHPSNPWSAMVLEPGAMMSTSTGEVTTVGVIGGEVQTVDLDGAKRRLRQFDIIGDKHRVVWLDDNRVPVAFRTEERGAAVDFILENHQGPTR
ncbi:MAG TPA: DUF6134 family protein [Stellaceae bacterium]|nr:DUF6134 family protein [Stellaceae bacterium]